MALIRKALPAVPAERTLKVIGGRWKIFILWHLFEKTQRLSELKRLIPGVSQKVLVQQLREMEADGLVRRKIYAQVPPRVEYSTTNLGKTLRPLTLALCEWGSRHASALTERDIA